MGWRGNEEWDGWMDELDWIGGGTGWRENWTERNWIEGGTGLD